MFKISKIKDAQKQQHYKDYGFNLNKSDKKTLEQPTEKQLSEEELKKQQQNDRISFFVKAVNTPKIREKKDELTKKGGIFKTCLTFEEYKAFKDRAKEYFIDKIELNQEELKILDLVEQKLAFEKQQERAKEISKNPIFSGVLKRNPNKSHDPDDDENSENPDGDAKNPLTTPFTEQQTEMLKIAKRKKAIRDFLTEEHKKWLNDDNITDPRCCNGVEAIIVELASKKIIDLKEIEEKLLGFPEGTYLFNMDGEERLIESTEQAYYKIDKAILAYNKNKYISENLTQILQEQPDKFIADFFSTIEMNRIKNFLIKENFLKKEDVSSSNYDDPNTNKAIGDALVKFFAQPQLNFAELIMQPTKEKQDYRKTYPVYIIEDLCGGRKFVSDFMERTTNDILYAPYKLLSPEKSARQDAIAAKHPKEDTKLDKVKATDESVDLTEQLRLMKGRALNAEQQVAELKRQLLDKPKVITPQDPPQIGETLTTKPRETKDISVGPEKRHVRSHPTIGVVKPNVLFTFDVVKRLEEEIKERPTIIATEYDAKFEKKFETFFGTLQQTIEKNQRSFAEISTKVEKEEDITQVRELNEIEMYHNLLVTKSSSNAIKVTEVDLESNERVELLNIAYSREDHPDKKIRKNIIKIDSEKLDIEGELDDKACLMMVLSARDLSKSKKFNIDNCEERPETAMKLFLFGKILGLTPIIDENTNKAIIDYSPNSKLLQSLKECYIQVSKDLNLQSEQILKLINRKDNKSALSN